MAEIDTSSYPKALPAASPLDIAGKLGGLEAQRVAIDTAKMEQANKALGFMTRAMGSLGPNASINDYVSVAQNAVKQGLVPQQQLNAFIERAQKAPNSQTFYKEFMTAAKDHQQQLDMHLGKDTSVNDNANIYTGKSDVMTNEFTPASKLPVQNAPGTQIIDNNRLLPNGQPNPNYLQPQLIGASGPSGPVPVPRARPPLPAERPVSGPTGPTTSNGTEFSNRFSAAPLATGAPPGVAGAITAVAEQSGKQFANALDRSKTFQSDLYPMQRVLEIVDKEGEQAFGQGTDALNVAKNAIATWIPGIDQKTIDSISNFEQAKKYLVEAARRAGNTGTNDQLAAAFDANPNTKMTGATIKAVIKSNIALRKMEQATTMLALQNNIPPEQVSSWIAKNQNQFDARAFGFDIMDKKAQEKLLNDFTEKDSDSKELKAAKAKAYTKFRNTLEFAKQAELIGQ